MKKLLLVIIAFFLILGLAAYYYRQQIVLSLVQKAAHKALPENKLSIASVDFRPLSFLEFKDLEVLDRSGNILAAAQSVKINYSISQLFKKEIKSVVISGLDCQKIKISKITFSLAFKAGQLQVNNLNAAIWGGNISAEARIKPTRALPIFQASIVASNIDLERLCKDLELDEKVEVTGTCDFNLNIAAEGKRFTDISGGLLTKGQRGKVIIKDKDSLSRVPVSNEPTMNLVLESLKDYYYDKGSASVSLEGRNVILKVFMQGAQGKRDLTIVVHDFHL